MYGGSQASSKDMNLLFPSSTAFKNSNSGGGGGDLQRNNSMDVNLLLHHHQQQQHHHHHHQRPQHQQQQQQMNTGLMRYRSAPSSLIANFIDGDSEVEGCDDFIPTPPPPPPPLPHRSSSPEAETMFARFMSSGGGGGGDSGSPDLSSIGEKPTIINNRNPQFMASMEQEAEQNGFPPASQMMFQTPLPPPPPSSQPSPLPMQNQTSNSTENSYRVGNSMGMDQQHHSQLKMENTTNTSNLIRHSSSPAGLFSHLSVENGFAVMRGIGNYRAGNGTNGEAAAANTRLKGQMTFSSRPPSSTGLMSQISEIESESMGGSSADEGSYGNGSGASNRFMPGGGFPVASWDDSPLENFPSLKRFKDINGKLIPGLNSSENQNGESGNHTTGLTHHFSLPKNSAEMAAILQFQDSVPCKIRAKRGCATHPRSIAERVRRTRISERMRKLQELVPNMDKQTNTADMLDLAVDYIKDLQKQVKSLNDNRANCTCANKLKA